MVHELMYTSAPKGLFPGGRGFCTVAATRSLPPPLIEKLEALSGYRPLFPPLDPRAALNPVAWSHVRLSAAGRNYRVLSRVAAAGLDYSERTNLFAHHLVLDGDDLPRGGPGWLLRQPGLLTAKWDGEVRHLTGRALPRGEAPPGMCRAWQQTTGDAGWAGVVAEAFIYDPNRPVYLLFDPGFDPLPLVAEALTLLTTAARWEVTFTTYYAGLPQGVPCLWRCVPRGSAEAAQASRLPGALILSLGPAMGPAKGGALVEQARTGQAPPPPPNHPPDWHDDTALVEAPRPSASPIRPVRMAPTHPTIDVDWPDEPPAVPPARGAAPPAPPVSQPTPARAAGGSIGSWIAGFAIGFGAGVVLAAVVVVLLWVSRSSQEADMRAQAADHKSKEGTWESAKKDLLEAQERLKTAVAEGKEDAEKLRAKIKDLDRQLQTEKTNLQKEKDRTSQQAQKIIDLEGLKDQREKEALGHKRYVEWLEDLMKQVPVSGRPATGATIRKPSQLAVDEPTTIKLPSIGPDQQQSYDLKLKPDGTYLLAVADLPKEEDGVKVYSKNQDKPTKKLTLFSSENAQESLLANLEVAHGQLEFQWRGKSATAARLLHKHRLRLFDTANNEVKSFELLYPVK
jgi:hypothetical protein